MDTNETTTTAPIRSTYRDVHKERLEAFEKAWETGWDVRGFAPGQFGAELAKLWNCSLAEAFREVIWHIEQGAMCPQTEESHYQASFELVPYGGKKKNDLRKVGARLRESWGLFEALDPSKPWPSFDPSADVVLIAFGRLVPRDFALYASGRPWGDETDASA